MVRRIDTRDVASLIRAQLKESFGLPARFFSVRIDRYAGGSSVEISWTDGPTSDAVRAAIGPYVGGRFNGMTDIRYSADQWFCAKHGVVTAQTTGSDVRGDNGIQGAPCCGAVELVHFANTSLGVSRRLSPEFSADLTQVVATLYGEPIAEYDPDLYYAPGSDYLGTLVHQESISIYR